MATVYSGGPLQSSVGPISRQDTPAELVTNAADSIVILPLQTLTLQVSGDGGATFVSIPFTAPLPLGPYLPGDAQSIVDTLNILMPGFGPDGIEWFVPQTDSPSGIQIGVRTLYTGKNAMIRVVGGTAIPNGFNWKAGDLARGVEGYTQFLIGPSPGDPFTALSVNNYQTGLRSRDYHIIHKMGKATDSKGIISAISTNGTSIDVSPVGGVEFNAVFNLVSTPYYYYDSEGITGLNNTYLDVPGNFVANTWYYVYVYYFTGGLLSPAGFKWEISTTPPNIYNLYKSGDTTRKYLFPFRTGAGGAIAPFMRSGNTQSYLGRHGILTAGNSAIPATIDATSWIPPNCLFGLLRLFIDNSGNLAEGVVIIRPDKVSGVTGTELRCSATGTTTIQLYVPTGNQKYEYFVQDPATFLGVDVWGFRD